MKKKYIEPIKNQDKVLITTSIAYVNSAPHIGYALELAQADILARASRAQSDKVYFLTGTDENGLKNYQTATKQNLSPQAFVDKNSAKFLKLTKDLEISNDNFIRTSSEEHHTIAQEFWQKLFKAGDIYPKEYQGLYCVGGEAFILSRDLVKGHCPHHQKAPEKVKEINYFFRLGKYKNQIYELVKSDTIKILPIERKLELLNLIKDAEDISFSRSSDQLPWGVEVPSSQEGPKVEGFKGIKAIENCQLKIENSQIMYVWCDALVNYISGLPGKSIDEKIDFWQTQDKIIHFVGKDILRFHGLIWLGMLLSAGLKLPSEIRVHGFITQKGQKISKSLGNTVDPFEYIKKYGADPLRFYLLNEIPEYGDGDWSEERFKEVYNSLLANELGNLVQRSIKIKNANFKPQKLVPSLPRDENLKSKISNPKSLNQIWLQVRRLNAQISEEKLWESQTSKNKIAQLYQDLYAIADSLTAYLPKTAQEIHRQLSTLTPSPIFPRI